MSKAKYNFIWICYVYYVVIVSSIHYNRKVLFLIIRRAGFSKTLMQVVVFMLINQYTAENILVLFSQY